MKLDVMRPEALIDINPLSNRWSGVGLDGGNLKLGSMARMADVAANGDIQRNYPAVASALNLAASPQLRNMASLGGNVLQRTRCTYFRDVSYDACNKRSPGSGCAALNGFNRTHAVLGTSDQCIATYPGDFAQALMALDATVEITGKAGVRSMPFAELHKLPGSSPQIETTLMPSELISGFLIQGRWPRSTYLKVRDRQSYEFALASAAVALDVQDGTIRDARIALGGVATVPWRAREAEALIKGQKLDDGLAARAADAAFAGATTRKNNAFKIALGKRVVTRALHQAAVMEI
jgi:xanthine dehydrogenase YagS FAD-binding subunit